MKIAITTPTGKIAGQLTDLLLKQGGHEITLIVRDPAKVAAFTKRGAKTAQADLEHRDQVIAALKGVDVAFLLSPPRYDAPDFRAYQNKIGDNFAAAVRANKLKRVVFLSSVGAQHKDGTGPIAGLHDIEAKLNAAAKEVGGSVTHLRPAAFMENWFMNLATIKDHGAVFVPIKPDAKFAHIATADIAKVALEVVTDTKWSGVNVRELLGPQDLSMADGVRIITAATGKPVQFVQVPAEQAKAAMTGMGVGADLAAKYVEMYAGFESGRVAPERPRNAQSTTPTRFEDFARAALAPAIRS